MKIKKTATAKHEQTLSPLLRDFIATAQSVPLPELRSHLSTFPAEWPFPRGDLYHWIGLLNRFDTILEDNVTKYKLKDGPQTIRWEESDKDLVLGVLMFSKLLVENCGNRSLYASSGQINDLLNTTDLDVLFESLSLGTRLAQRYYTSRTRGSTSTNATLLASHYNIILERVVKIASPFVKGIAAATTPAGKNLTARAVLPVYATDLGCLARDEKPITEVTGKGKGKSPESKEGNWEEWGGAWVSYYVNPTTQKAAIAPAPSASFMPTTPTPVRRTSLHHSHSHGPSHHHHQQQQQPQQTPGSTGRGRRASDDGITESVDAPGNGGLHTLEVPYSKIKTTSGIEEILRTHLPELPSDTHYEFLQRLRVASALAGGLETRRKILAIRILALTNLAYVYSEAQFQTKILTLDQDEPRRLQLVYQLAELVQSNDGRKGEVPRWLQTLAIGGLEAFSRHKSRTPDVLNALSVNVNHGVLFYLMRKAVAELAAEDGTGDMKDAAEEWREALFALVGFLPTTNHAGQLLVSAGLIPILVELIQLRTRRALRHIPRALQLLDQLIYSVHSAFQNFANAKGLDAVVDLVSDQVDASLEDLKQGGGMPKEHKSQQTDYEIGYYRQQALRMVFKFMQHMMGQSGGGADRLLRNLIDNPQLLNSIKIIIGNGRVWGSNVWSTVVGMVSAFIHNEPTSYAAIHEARVTHTFLESITGRTGLAEEEERKKKKDEEAADREQAVAGSSASTADEDQVMEETTPADEDRKPEETTPKDPTSDRIRSPAEGILPSPDVIGCIPTAFGAICLNASGLAVFQASGALETYFEIFENPEHVKHLRDSELGNLLGNQFDELVRHHPVLRDSVMKTSIRVLERLYALGQNFAVEKGMGAKLWLDDGSGGLVVAGGRRALARGAAINNQIKPAQSSAAAAENNPKTSGDEEDVEMGDADASSAAVVIGETNPDGSLVDEVVTLADIYDEESEATDNSNPSISDYIDVALRYTEGFLQNSAAIRKYIEGKGLDHLLNFYLLPSLPHDFATSQANQMLCRVVHVCCEPSLPEALKAVFAFARKAVDQLEPLLNYAKKEAFFAPLTNPSHVLPPRLQAGLPSSDDNTIMREESGTEDDDVEAEKQAVENVRVNGTKLVKDLVTVHSICFLLQDLYTQPLFNVRTSVTVFMQVTMEADQDNVLISKLGALQRMCVWEEILMQNGIPQTWNEATRVKDSSAAAATAAVEEEVVPGVGAVGTGQGEATKTAEDRKEAEKAVVEKEGKTARFRNVKTIRFLISQFPTTVTPFLQGLAKATITRRTNDPSHKQQALKLVDSIADTMHQHLTWERLATSDSVNDKYSYWIVMLSAVMTLLLEGVTPDIFATPKNTPADRQPSVITTFLVTFKQRGGLEVIKEILEAFWDELKDMPVMAESVQLTHDRQTRIAHAFGGIKIILSLFAYLVSPKAVVESSQSQQLNNRGGNDYERPDYFNSNQLLVELRIAILPMARKMWQEASIENASSSIVKSVIEILAVTLKADAEGSAFTRKLVERTPALNNTLSWKSMLPHKEQIKKLTEMGFDEEAAADALMRSGGTVEGAAQWLTSHGDSLDSGLSLSGPPPRANPAEDDDGDEEDDDDDDEEDITDIDGDITRNQPPADSHSADAPQSEAHTEPQPEQAIVPPASEMDTSEHSTASVPPADEGSGSTPDGPQDTPMGRNVDELVVAGSEPSRIAHSDKGKEKQEGPTATVVTVEDLNDLRTELRESLINRSLDVLQVHTETTFDLADLIKCAFSKSPADTRKDVASTIVQSLLSLQMDDDLRPKAKTIASTAHLLGLILQSQEFYESCVEDLNEQLPILIGFIKVYPGEPAPWVANILLVVEKLLSEHSQPEKVKFVPPGQPEPETVVESTGMRVPDEVQDSLMDAILSILPNIGKEDLLPLSVARILVLLTRRRELALRLMDNSNLQKVFHMLRRQAGTGKTRVQSSIMLILRHIIEDEETIKAFMKAEISAQFNTRANRQLDTNTFIKTSSSLVLRNPDIFIEVVNEMCKLAHYEPHLRSQHLSLKPTEPVAPPSQEEDKAESAESSELVDKGDDGAEKEDHKEEKEVPDKPKAAIEVKPPSVEKPDGVVHFLLSELFAIKDTQDITPTSESSKEESGKVDESSAREKADVQMNVDDNQTSGISENAAITSTVKQDKPEFKAEQHPTFLYRCFILQALTELLSCYNRCKIEFINYSRKANPRDPITPSKPRSAILGYLLNDLIPLESLSQPEDIAYKKKAATSQWAILTLVSLCTNTGESPGTEDDPTLLFVRKFVLEVSLKAFKDASASSEPLDSKYAKMLSLTDLFYRALSSRPSSPGPVHAHASVEKSQLQISKIMLEKNFIAALTTALADVDINFPSSRRVIKYMLKPLKLLSKTAVDLGEGSNISATGSTDEDEISTASSVTDIDDIREETPDLYRNSTLGMFEGGEMADDDASSFDEDEDDDEIYDEEMEFDDAMEDDNGSEISDEDEEEGGDMDVEIVVESTHVGDDDSDEDDEDDDLSDDMDEDGGDVEVIDELAEGPHEIEPYGSGGDDDWHSEPSDEDDDDEDDHDADAANMIVEPQFETIARALGMPQDNGGEIDLDDEDREDGFIDEGDDDEDLEGDDDDDDMEDDDGMADEYDDDEGASSAVPWGWANDGDAPVMTRAQPRGAGGWFTLSGAAREPPVFMSRAATRPRHAVGAGDHNRSNLELNPLLQQTENEPTTHRHSAHRHDLDSWVHSMDPGHGGGAAGTMNAIHNLINLMHRGGHTLPNGNIQFHATFPHSHRHLHGGLPREIQNALGGATYRPVAETPRHHREDPSTVVNSFAPCLTNQRWAEEARLVFGGSHLEVAQKVVNAILVHLVPPALEEERIRKEKEEEARKEAQRLEEERKKKEEEEKAAREKAEAEEKARKEAEEKEAAERAAAEAAAAEEARAVGTVIDNSVPEGEQAEAPAAGEAMEGVETGPAADEPAGPSEPIARATVTIRGSEVDITGLGIDASFLEAIPDDLREEVLTNHVREQRAEAAANNQPSEISREFLDALPEDIRDELVAQEAADRRRREQEAAQVRQGGAAELNLQDFLATLDPSLRQTVLLEQDQESLAQFPQAIIEEAQALRGGRGFSHFVEIPRVGRASGLRPEEPKPLKKPVRKGTVQLLDKAGVATLLRLMFIPQVGSTRATLHEILLNICENRQNRSEVVNLLLSILQDGSADMVSVERSFAQLSVRAKQSGPQKTPVQPGLKRTNTGSGLLAQTSGEISPLMVAQQCLSALLFLVHYNEHIPPYFLSEHDISTGLKRSISRKGKGKAPVEAKANKYALNTLLSLLDRQLVTESSSVMDQLSVLLSEITRPLQILLKKDKKKAEDDKPPQEASAAPGGEGSGENVQPNTLEPGASVASTTQPEAATSEMPTAGEEPQEAAKEDTKEDEKPKKQRNLIPPVVPEHNLRLVVNILTARECSSKTFRETLATMQNLSGIPGAKDVFGAELIRQAQGLGAIILDHLAELMQQIKSADNGTEVQGMALSNFSPASSEQAKLLRVLTALDYLFDPKRSSKDKPEDKSEDAKDKSSAEAESKTESDVLTRLYETLTFQPLWDKLSQCLSAIHERSDMLHVATILLPLIESLMVVCKNSGLKEAPTQRRESKAIMSTSPNVSVPMRDLFFNFTEEHRKILNEMVRNNPKLMSGSFSLLVNNPKVLDFDNKRNYFNRRLHTRSGRESHPTLQLNVRRDQVFLDSYKSMYYKTGDEIKYAKLSIRFHGEEGVDAGGVTREWFQVMARQMFNPDYALFIPVASDRTTFHPNRQSEVNPEHLSFFKFIGRIIGKALYEGRVLDCHFSRAVYKRILGKSVSLKDMETLDLDYYKSLVWILENETTDIITETFSLVADDFGVEKIIDLVTDGQNIPVTDENKHEYVRLIVEYKMLTSVKEQMEHFLIGFHDIVPAELVSIFNEQELELLISGMPEIDVDDWRNNTEYHNYTASSPQIQWFWRAVRSFDKEERAKLLQFVTGTSKVPLNGFKELEGMNGWSKFNIHRDYGNKDRLPSSHTCFNQIDLPEYESYENLRQNLMTAITQGAEYFGFA